MKTNKLYKLALMYATIGANANKFNQGNSKIELDRLERKLDLIKRQKELDKKRSDEFNKRLKLKQGLKEFDIKGVKIIALNKKNALKKYNKLKLNNYE